MLWLMVLGYGCLIAAVAWTLWGATEAADNRRLRRVSAEAQGEVCGLVHHRPLMQYDRTGDVPQDAFRIWGCTTAHGAHGFASILQALTSWAWYPCVRFWADDEEQTVVLTSASEKDVWTIGQRVRVQFEPESPLNCVLVGDPGPGHAVRGDFLTALIFALAGIILLVLYYF